jgi:simple sugar transport system ATP-binding protein
LSIYGDHKQKGLHDVSPTARIVKGEHPCGAIFLPAARLEEGLIRGLTITEHFALQDTTRGFLVRGRAAFKQALCQIEKFRIAAQPQSVVESLSGGNQQRLLLSFLPRQPKLLLLEHPTRGLDLESSLWVWQYLQQYCAQGTSIVFSSSELDEIVMWAERILIFFNGRIIKDVKSDETNTEQLGHAIAGRI